MLDNPSTAPSNRQSVSPLRLLPMREIRGIRLFRAISQKLARRRSSSDAVSHSSSSSSSSSAKKPDSPLFDTEDESVASHRLSRSSSETENHLQVKARHHLSVSAESILAKVFQNLNLNGKTRSNKKDAKRSKCKKTAPIKRILRAPETYTYVRGLSGLPTQIVAKNHPKMILNSSCGCTMQFMAGLNR